MIWIVNSASRYRWDEKKFLEVIAVPPIVICGLFWLHYKFIKIYTLIKDQKHQIRIVPLDSLLKISNPSYLLTDNKDVKNLTDNYPAIHRKISFTLAYAFWNDDKRYFNNALLTRDKIEKFFSLNMKQDK